MPTDKIIIPIQNWRHAANVRAAYTMRGGAPFESPYDHFNLASHVEDDCQKVNENRQALCRELDLPRQPLWLNQVHGTDCVVNDNNRGVPTADASFTREAGRVCAVLSADCLPILVCSIDGREVAAIHAGWRGLLNGVIEQPLLQFASPAEQIQAWLGPRISSHHYEVGPDLIEKFRAADTDYEAAVSRVGSRQFFDLGAIAQLQLQRAGIKNIQDCRLCTYERENEFYSYRRDGITGRFACLIWRDR